MIVAGLVVAVLALVVGTLAFLNDRRHAQEGGRLQSEQAAAIARLVAIEERRDESQRQRQVAALQEAARLAEAERVRSLTAALEVTVPVVAANSSRKICVQNIGLHDASIDFGRIWNGERDGAGIRCVWRGLSADRPLKLGPGDKHLLIIDLVGSGPATVDLAWTDGIGRHEQSFDVELPERETFQIDSVIRRSR